ncbi:MAG TPA: hypothetical protein VG124_17170 [Beijerinckiaceae bacterium]|jgi:hypothetical protein|nr:hypothetical protein [Beijerinckiaceae bacterium]
MATLLTLVQQGELIQIGGGLERDEQPERLLYAFPHVIDWLDKVLPGLAAELHDQLLSPLEQADILFHDFVSGADMAFYERCHSMIPDEEGVWELKSEDLRFFGWFPAKGAFIIADIDTKARITERGLAYLGQVKYRREMLGLDEPKFKEGGYSDVL